MESTLISSLGGVFLSFLFFCRLEQLEIEGADLGPFYSQLKSIKDYHRRQPQNTMALDTIEIGSILDRVKVSNNNLNSIFSGEERNGRFLDLYRIYDEAINFNPEAKIDYLTFLQIFDRPHDYTPESKRSSAAYSTYLDNLLEYLNDFVQRTRPISGLNLEKTSLKELEELHRQQLEEVSNSKQDFPNLYCGPCNKLFSNASVFEAHFKGKKHIKALEVAKNTASASEKTEKAAEVSLEAKEKLIEQRLNDLKKRQSLEIKEFLISLHGDLLKEVKEATKGNVERRQALTAEERLELEVESDFEDEEDKNNSSGAVADDENAIDDGKIYNPLKLPLDWDGKPIPFWLWKLHGLGVQFPCEICGNFVYRGRSAFVHHF